MNDDRDVKIIKGYFEPFLTERNVNQLNYSVNKIVDLLTSARTEAKREVLEKIQADHRVSLRGGVYGETLLQITREDWFELKEEIKAEVNNEKEK